VISNGERKRLDHITKKACKTAGEEVIRTAINYGTSLVVEIDGETVEIDPNTLNRITSKKCSK